MRPTRPTKRGQKPRITAPARMTARARRPSSLSAVAPVPTPARAAVATRRCGAPAATSCVAASVTGRRTRASRAWKTSTTRGSRGSMLGCSRKRARRWTWIRSSGEPTYYGETAGGDVWRAPILMRGVIAYVCPGKYTEVVTAVSSCGCCVQWAGDRVLVVNVSPPASATRRCTPCCMLHAHTRRSALVTGGHSSCINVRSPRGTQTGLRGSQPHSCPP